MPEGYEIPSAGIAAHWWAKHTLPQLIEQAERVRQEQEETLRVLRKAREELEGLQRANKDDMGRIGRWLERYGRGL